MASDDLTDHLKEGNQDDNTTQPTITAVFRLLQEVKAGQYDFTARLDEVEKVLNSRIDAAEKGLNSRIDAAEKGLSSRIDDVERVSNARIDSLESRLARDFAAVDARFAALSEEFNSGLLRLSDKLCDRIDRIRLHAEADYEDLLKRLRKLESRAS